MIRWHQTTCPKCKEENWLNSGEMLNNSEGIEALKCWACHQFSWVDEFSEKYHAEGITSTLTIEDYADQGHKAPECKYVKELEAFAKYVRDNYDHDTDAHTYDTTCRMCYAADVIGKEKE